MSSSYYNVSLLDEVTCTTTCFIGVRVSRVLIEYTQQAVMQYAMYLPLVV